MCRWWDAHIIAFSGCYLTVGMTAQKKNYINLTNLVAIASPGKWILLKTRAKAPSLGNEGERRDGLSVLLCFASNLELLSKFNHNQCITSHFLLLIPDRASTTISMFNTLPFLIIHTVYHYHISSNSSSIFAISTSIILCHCHSIIFLVPCFW